MPRATSPGEARRTPVPRFHGECWNETAIKVRFPDQSPFAIASDLKTVARDFGGSRHIFRTNFSSLRHRILATHEPRLLPFGACHDQFKIPLPSGVTLLRLFAAQVGGVPVVRSTNPAAPTSQTLRAYRHQGSGGTTRCKAEAVEY